MKRQVEGESQDQVRRDQDVTEDVETVEIDFGTAEEEIDDAI